MTNSITPKVAYIPLTYPLSVDEFLQMWKIEKLISNNDCNKEAPTQEDYDKYCITRAGTSFNNMQDICDCICLRDA